MRCGLENDPLNEDVSGEQVNKCTYQIGNRAMT